MGNQSVGNQSVRGLLATEQAEEVTLPASLEQVRGDKRCGGECEVIKCEAHPSVGFHFLCAVLAATLSPCSSTPLILTLPPHTLAFAAGGARRPSEGGGG